MIRNLTRRIKDIGKSGMCLDEDLSTFLPNLPAITGDEFIFTISWANAGRYVDQEIDDFIRGLHFLEEKYRSFAKSDFGFGSPSPSHKVISKLRSKDAVLAEKLTAWISENGGNYYIANSRRKKSTQNRMLFD